MISILIFYPLGRTLLIDFVALIERVAPLPVHKPHKSVRAGSTPEPDLAPRDAEAHNRENIDPEEAVVIVRALLGSLLTFGIDEAIDKLCVNQLGVKAGPSSLGHFRFTS